MAPRLGAGPRSRGKKVQIAAGFSALVSVIYFGTTLAANVSLGNAPIEFGQGSRGTVACDDTGITTAISETWDNTSSYFKVSQITLSEIKNSATNIETGIGCRGKTIKISLIGASGKLEIGSGEPGETEISIVLPGANGAMGSGVTGANASAVYVDDFDAVDGASLTITVPANINASDVERIALETE